MKRYWLWIILMMCWLPHVEAEETVVRLTGPMTLSSNETWDGHGRTYESCGFPAFQLQGTAAVLRDVTVRQCEGDEVSAITVNGLGHQLIDVSVDANGIGIDVRSSYGVRLIRPYIEGNKIYEGIGIFDSEAVEVDGAVVKRVRDGIYIENGSKHRVFRPTVSESRYGVHLMFPQDVAILFPTLHHNVTGAMIMGTDRVTLSQGQIYDQVGDSAIGLMLYQATGTTIDLTTVRGNAVGIYVEQSEWTTLQRNTIQGNDIGFRLKKANEMSILQNDVTGNRYPVTMVEASNNLVKGNVWGSPTLDLNEDGLSELSFRADPYLYVLSDTYEAFELLYGSPGLLVLETILRSPDDVSFVDVAPKSGSFTLDWNGSSIAYWIMIGSIISWIWGRRKHEIV